MAASSVISTYRSLLRETRQLPHIYLRHVVQFFQVKVQQYFRKNIITKQNRPRLVDAKLRKARKELRRLRRANEGDRKALQQVLDLAYGRQGKLKHELMKHFLSNPFEPLPPRIIPAVERSRPPSYSPELTTLLTSIHARTLTKPLKLSALHAPPTLPERADPSSEEARLLGPFSRRREVNIRWRYHTGELKKTYFPVELTRPAVDDACRLRETGAEELKLLEEVERLASSPHSDGIPRPRRERRTVPEQKSVSQPIQAEFSSSLPRRFLRRRYRELLSRIPILTPNGKASTGCSTALSPLALSNGTRPLRVGQGTEDDVDWIIRAEAENMRSEKKNQIQNKRGRP
ncbi:hypothetical protein JB92DRAFT_2741094 [Gautieria morchelliformis]|nr:hypothetical protein JB92DRAFT_2741094 [Gautieria morchelliformis]